MTTTTKAAKAPNFTEAQVAAIQAAAPVTQEKAKALAEQIGKPEKSIIAKAVRMGIYQRKAATTKTGAAVERKEAIVAELAQLTGANLDGLEKAPKPALQALRNFMAAGE